MKQNMNQEGKQTVTVSYQGKTATYEITVKAKDTPVTPDDPVTPNKSSGLPVGAVVGIVIGSALVDTDPLLRCEVDSITHEIILSFLGRVQLEVVSALLSEKYKLETVVKEPTVIYMERPLKSVCLTELKGYQAAVGKPVIQPRRPNSRLDKVRYMFQKIM